MKFKPLMALPPLMFLALAALFYFGNLREDRDSLPSAREGQPAPPVVLTELEGKTLFDDATLRDGEVKLVNYWASWCAPCRAEHPLLDEELSRVASIASGLRETILSFKSPAVTVK